ncbi:Putative transport protein [hydrothermal vent metagenome]|uniref:Putative transport protein n=1 Tax=hydrothermal vent metagenome TaxID=652676 RepID=A0A1W1CGH9_9ZZZZ
MQEQHAKVGYTFIVMASVVIILAGIKMAAVIIVPFLLALFLATILSPFYLWLKKLGINEIFSLVIIVFFLLLVISSMITLIGNSVQDFSQNIPMYELKLRTDLQHMFEMLDQWGIHVPKKDILAMFHTNSIMHYIAGTLKSFGSLLTNSFMIILTVIFMLMEISQFTAKLSQTNIRGLTTLTQVSDKIKHYILLKALTSAATGIIITIILKAMGIHYAVLWGLLAFLLNFIPNIGSILAAIPAVLMALIQFNLTTALIVSGAYLAVNVLIGSILEPRILGKGLGLSTLIVFLSLIFWGWLLGPVGMLLSVPLTVMVKIALDTQPDTKWIATMLGSGGDTKAAENA